MNISKTVSLQIIMMSELITKYITFLKDLKLTGMITSVNSDFWSAKLGFVIDWLEIMGTFKLLYFSPLRHDLYLDTLSQFYIQ